MSSYREAPQPSRVLGETNSGARNLPRFLCSLLEPGPVLVLGASEAALEAANHHDVTVLDWNHARLAALGEMARDRGNDVRLLCRNPVHEDLGLAPRSYRNVVCLDVLERLPNDVAVLEKLQRVLEAGGRLVVRVPARPWSRNGVAADFGARRYDSESLRSALEEAAFRTIRVRHWNLVGVPSALLEGRRRQPDDAEGRRVSRRRPWWDSTVDLWYREVERRVSFPVGVSLVAVATPFLERARVERPDFTRALRRRGHREAYEPMAAAR
ncbi:MAG: class I SAM-dependent methyltransferase [bacterium]